MCLATPVKIKKIVGKKAVLDNGHNVDLVIVKNAKVGDWILCHADLAINKISEKEAKEILKLNKNCPHKK